MLYVRSLTLFLYVSWQVFHIQEGLYAQGKKEESTRKKDDCSDTSSTSGGCGLEKVWKCIYTSRVPVILAWTTARCINIAVSQWVSPVPPLAVCLLRAHRCLWLGQLKNFKYFWVDTENPVCLLLLCCIPTYQLAVHTPRNCGNSMVADW